jgi:hypothetical protein
MNMSKVPLEDVSSLLVSTGVANEAENDETLLEFSSPPLVRLRLFVFLLGKINLTSSELISQMLSSDVALCWRTRKVR